MRRWGTEVPRASSGSLILPSPVTSLQHLLQEEKQCARGRAVPAAAQTSLPRFPQKQNKETVFNWFPILL